MQILIVEDELIPANYLKKVLLAEGYDVLPIVDKGSVAICVAKEKKPDIILMDVMLKDRISGCDAALEISQENPQIRIVFLTAFSDQEMIDFAVKSKAFAYLLKPYRDKEILATLALAKAEMQKHTTSQNILVDEEKNILQLMDGYSFHKEEKRLFRLQNEISCGPKAIKLIALLCEHQNYTVSTDDILEILWPEGNASQQKLRSLIHRIREQTHQGLIVNVNKLGYKIELKAQG